MPTHNGSDMSDIQLAPLESTVLEYHPELDKCGGPFSLLYIKVDACTVLLPLPYVPKQFHTTVVKIFLPSSDNDVNDQEPQTFPDKATANSQSAETFSTFLQPFITCNYFHKCNEELEELQTVT